MDAKKAALLSVFNTPGYAVLMEYFEQGAKDLEADLLNTDPAQPGHVIVGRHSMAVGAWRHFLEVKARIEKDVKDALTEPAAELTERDRENLYIQSLGN